MTVQSVLLPLFVQVGLVFVLLFWMAYARMTALRSGAVRIEDIRLAERKWPPQAQAAANCFSNQFELPVLFYPLVILGLMTKQADGLFVMMAWIFVATRIVHAAVYVTSNHLPTRAGVYAIGMVVLLAMWIIFAVRILAA